VYREDGRIKFFCGNERGQEKNVYPLEMEGAILDCSKSFYTIEGRKCFYVSCTANRQWRQGFFIRNYTVKLLMNVVQETRNLVRGLSTWKIAASALKPEYTPLEEVESRLAQGQPSILSDSLAVTEDKLVFFKDKDVGVFRKGEVVLHSEGEYVKDHLMREGVPFCVKNRSRKIFNTKFSLWELEGLGVNVEDILIQELARVPREDRANIVPNALWPPDVALRPFERLVIDGENP
jgi:hypothetical protein